MKRALVALGFALTVVGIHQLQLSIDEKRGVETGIQSLRYLPDGEALKLVSLGYENVIADLIWLRVVQVFGNRTVAEDDYNWIYHALEAVTTLDPRFVHAYLAGSMTLTVVADHVELSNRILEKGIKADLGEWRVPFILGFNYFNFLGEYHRAAEYIEMAADMPGRPDWLPLLAARLHVQANAPHLALEFLARVHESTHDARLRKKLETRITDVMIERDLLALEWAIERYRARYGAPPDTLDHLVAAGVVTQVPLDPFGATYVIDGRTGEVSSPSRPDRMRVFHPHRREEDG